MKALIEDQEEEEEDEDQEQEQEQEKEEQQHNNNNTNNWLAMIAVSFKFCEWTQSAVLFWQDYDAQSPIIMT